MRYLDDRWQAVSYAFHSAPDTEFFHGADGSGCQGLGQARDSEGTFEIDFFHERESWFGSTTEQLLAEPLAFVDRFGTYCAPFAVAERAARWICQRYPEVVLRRIGKEEADLREEAIHGRHVEYGKRRPVKYTIEPERCAELLREREPIFAVVRLWCGDQSFERWNELEAIRAENMRLRKLLSETASFLRWSRHYVKAAELRREIDEHGWTLPDPPEPEPERQPVDKLAFTPPEVAAFLGVTPQRVRKAIAAGQLFGVKMHRYTLVPKAALEAFLEGRSYEPEPPKKEIADADRSEAATDQGDHAGAAPAADAGGRPGASGDLA